MEKKEEALTLDQKIEDLKQQQEQARRHFDRLQGAIEILEQIKAEEDEKTD